MRKVITRDIIQNKMFYPLLPMGEGDKGDEVVLTSPRPTATPLPQERGIVFILSYVIGIVSACIIPAFAVQIHPVTKTGRQIQLDGFLLEWKKADAGPLAGDSAWSWDVINTREGLTGYFTTGKTLRCPSWTFRFLSEKLSPYKSMDVNTRAAGRQSFYRLSEQQNGDKKEMTVEWIVPWDSIWHDSSGAYQVGLISFDTCGDTLQPLILTGHRYRQQESVWGGVYEKGVFLGIMIALLIVLQRRVKATKRKKKSPVFDPT